MINTCLYCLQALAIDSSSSGHYKLLIRSLRNYKELCFGDSLHKAYYCRYMEFYLTFSHMQKSLDNRSGVCANTIHLPVFVYIHPSFNPLNVYIPRVYI